MTIAAVTNVSNDRCSSINSEWTRWSGGVRDGGSKCHRRPPSVSDDREAIRRRVIAAAVRVESERNSAVSRPLTI